MSIEKKDSGPWSTVIYVAVTVTPMLILLAWYMSGFFNGLDTKITATQVEVKDARVEAREQLTAARVSILKTIDSNQRNNDQQFNDLWIALDNKTVPHSQHLIRGANGCAIQQVINGRRVYIPVKCQ